MVKPISLVVFCSVMLYLILFFYVRSYAGESEQAYFSGHIMVGGAFVAGDLSLEGASTNDNRQISSLSQSPKNISEPYLIVLGSLDHTFAAMGTTLNLGPGSGLGVGYGF